MKTKIIYKRIKKWSDFLADAAIHPSNVYSVGLQFVYDHGQLPSGMTNITPGDILNLQRENGLSACDVPGHVDDWVTIDGNPGDDGGGSGSSVVTESSIPANPTDQQRGHVPTVGAVKDALGGKQDALPTGTAGQVLKKTQTGVEWDDESVPTISDGENNPVDLAGTVEVTSETATGSEASVTVTPKQGGGVEMKFSLPKGADGADGQDGAPGAPGHNPNLGTYLDTADTDKPTTGQAGDYFIVINTSAEQITANVWAWNGTAFADTGKSVENFGLQFASGQAVNAVKIKDENGEDVAGDADVLSAHSGKVLNEQLNGKGANYEDGKKIRWTGGSSEVVEADSTFILSEYVHIPNGATRLVYTYANRIISPTGMSWYDESKIWLSSSAGNEDSGERVLPIESNAKYLRATFLKTTMGTRASLVFKDANDNVLETWVPLEAQPSLFVKATEQTFTDAEKAQARENIGAAASSDVATISNNVTSLQGAIVQQGSRITNLEDSMQEVTGSEQNYIPHKRTDTSGALVDRNTTGVSVLIPIESAVGTSVRFNVGTTDLTDTGIALYSSDGTSLVEWWAGNVHPRTISITNYPTGAYLRMTFWLEEASSAYIEIKYAGETNYTRVWEPSEGTPSKYVQAREQTFTNAEQNQIKRNLGIVESGVVGRNADKLPMLVNSCRLYKSGNTTKDWQAVICTDMHAMRKANQNAIAVVNDGFMVDILSGSAQGNKNVPLIDAYINCGDIVGSDYTESAVITAFQTDYATLTKPGFVVVGNHDAGNSYYVALCCNHSQAYTAFIKPMVDKGFLRSGEYEAGKPYWYHDINNTLRGYKLRIIGLYEYDDALDLNEVYWRAITYDSSLSNIQVSTSYSVGDKVNAGNYTEYSFECVQAVTTSSNLRTDAETGKAPAYKVQRGRRVIRQTQAQWFLDTLCSTPENYGVIVIMHNPFSDSAKTMDNAFSWPANQLGSSNSQNDMATDFVRDAVAAFIAGSSYSANVVFKGKAAYMNIAGGNTYAYSVAKDFSTKNSGVKFLGFIGGHAHRDFIWKDDSENIYQIAPNCAFSYGDNAKFSDIRRTDSDGLAFDSLTVASFANGRIGLVKIGVNVTDRGTKRDYMVLDTNN